MKTPLHVLIVEDSEDDSLLLIRMLNQGGYEPVYERVETFDDMKRALDSQRWDVVIADYILPRFSAPAALELLKEKKLDIPFIIVSGAIGEETAVSAMKAGAQDYIMKSNWARLVPAIDRELRDAQNRQKRKQAEDEKKRMEVQLLQAQKMEAVGRLTGGVAHDFNNLLTAIRGYTDLAVAKAEPATQLYKDLREIQIASERAMSLTRQLLLFSRRQPVEFVPVDLNLMVENLFNMLRRLIGEDIEFRHELAAEPLTILADQTSIEQIIINLVVNARDAVHEGGTITIKTETCVIDKQAAKSIPQAYTGRFARFSLSDTGKGMDVDTQKRVFEPFFSTKQDDKGSGLGLSVVLGIIRQHKGWIHVASEVGKGSVFDVYLPIVPEQPAVEAKKEESLDKYLGKGERILVIEDEDGVRYFAEKALTRSGYTVFTASNQKEAMEVFQREMGLRLVFSDVVLPTMNGIELIEEMLSIKPDLKVLLTSGYTDQKSQWNIIKKKGYTFLQKPYTLSLLLKTIHESLA